jgi:protein MpaA
MQTLLSIGKCVVSFTIGGGLALLLSAPLPAGASTSIQALTPEQLCDRLIPRMPTVNKALCMQGGFSATGRVSQQGLPLVAKIVPATNRNKKQRPLRVLLMGGIHGDELTSAAIVYRWVEGMKGPISQSIDWRIMPVVNPDGLLADKASRMNANGVDLNRNFPTPGWDAEAPRYWQVRTRSDPRRFPGRAPLSEPESRWVEEEMRSFKPDVIISVHAPFGVLDFDGPEQPPRKFGRLLLNRVGVYPGSLGNYSGVHQNVPVITIELPNAQKMPPQAEVRRIWVDMLQWIARNVEPQQVSSVRTVSASEVKR